MLIIVSQSNAIWTSSTRPSRLRGCSDKSWRKFPRLPRPACKLEKRTGSGESRRRAARLLSRTGRRLRGVGVNSLFMTSVLKTSRRRWRDLWHFRRRRLGRRRTDGREARDQHDEIAPSIKRCSSVRPSVCQSAVPSKLRSCSNDVTLAIHSCHFTHDVHDDLSLIAAALSSDSIR